MSNQEMFEKASKIQLRFNTVVGNLSVEDLWQVPLTVNRQGEVNLDDIARELSKKLKESETESFVVKSPKSDEITQLKFDIVKHIIDQRLLDAEKAEQRKVNHEKKQFILSIIQSKENEALTSANLDDLKKMLEEME